VIRITRNRDNFRFFYQNTAVVGKHQIKDSPKMIRNPIELEKIIKSKYFGNALHSRA
jgi:hypothetical protein